MLVGLGVASVGAIALGVVMTRSGQSFKETRDTAWTTGHQSIAGMALVKGCGLRAPGGGVLTIGANQTDLGSLPVRIIAPNGAKVIEDGDSAEGKKASIKLEGTFVQTAGSRVADKLPGSTATAVTTSVSADRQFEGRLILTRTGGSRTVVPMTLYFDSTGKLEGCGVRQQGSRLTRDASGGGGHSAEDCLAVGGRPIRVPGAGVVCRVPNLEASPAQQVRICPVQWAPTYDDAAEASDGFIVSAKDVALLVVSPSIGAVNLLSGGAITNAITGLGEWATGDLFGSYPNTAELLAKIKGDEARSSGLFTGKITKCTVPSDELKCPVGYESMPKSRMPDQRPSCVYELTPGTGCPSNWVLYQNTCQPPSWRCSGPPCTLRDKCPDRRDPYWKTVGVGREKWVTKKDGDGKDYKERVTWYESSCVPASPAKGCPPSDAKGFQWKGRKVEGTDFISCRPAQLDGICPAGWKAPTPPDNICEPPPALTEAELNCPDPLPGMAPWVPYVSTNPKWRLKDPWGNLSYKLCY